MNREEAIRDLDIIRFNPHWDELVNEEYWKELMEMAITALQNQPVWIPVSERLPEKEGRYLVTFRSERKTYLVGYGNCRMSVDGKKIGYGWYDLHYAIYFDKKSIIAWMPLPEPYQESEEENGEVL